MLYVADNTVAMLSGRSHYLNTLFRTNNNCPTYLIAKNMLKESNAFYLIVFQCRVFYT